MKISKVEPQKKNSYRYNIYIDNEFFSGVSDKTILDLDIFEGKEVDNTFSDLVLDYEDKAACLHKCYDYISRRMHSEKELRTKLWGKFHAKSINSAIDRLKELNYVNDQNFASRWCSSRSGLYGPTRIKQELLKKGITKDLIEISLQNSFSIDLQVDTAKKLAIRKYKPSMSKDEVFKYIGGLLSRKGFSYDIIKKVINELN